MLDLTYPNLLKLFPEHLDPKRSESASFLIWYLENYYRLDTLEAVDSVCDQRGDKGVDGIFVNDSDQTITILQSRISQNAKSTIGDTPLKEFAGTISQFDAADKIEELVKSAGNAQVGSLAKRLDLAKKIGTYELRGEFVSNINLDANGLTFLRGATHIVAIDHNELVQTYISDERNLPVHPATQFDIGGFGVSEYIVDADTKAVIAPIRAKELVALSGIADQSLFTYNVRGPLGRTQVNKDIVKTIRSKDSHKHFPLFHNGITIIAGGVEIEKDKLTASDYFVVNGCQSLTALFNNKADLTDDLRILAKFIKMDPRSDWAARITEFSNNQNGVKARDFKSNSQTQIRLPNEFSKHYSKEYAYEIKRGEVLVANTIISNEVAGLFLMAFDLGEPWGTHRKYEVFEDKHADLFARPEVTADRIVLCQVIMDAIESELPEIRNRLFARYVLTCYLILHIVHEIIANDPLSSLVFTSPQSFVRNTNDRAHFKTCVRSLVGDIVIDLNEEIGEAGEDFDYRDKLRDAEWVELTTKTLVADYLKQVRRGRITSFEQDWNSRSENKQN